MKRFISLFLVLVILCSVVGVSAVTTNAATQEYVSGDFKYTVSNNQVTITDYIGSETSVTIPSVIDGYNVKAIGEKAFGSCKVTYVSIPYGVTDIDFQAFYNCRNLSAVDLPDGLRWIGEMAFGSCTSLKSIEIPDNTIIIKDAFHGCSGLTSVTIGKGIKSIPQDVFNGCKNLKNVYISDMNQWLHMEFVNIYSNPMCYAENLYLNNKPITEIVIPDDVTSIPIYAFKGCKGLTSITIPENVTSIGERAFSDCISLAEINLPNNITDIDGTAFINTAYYNNESNWENDVLYIGNYLTNTNWAVSGNYKIREGTIAIANYAFYDCKGLESVEIPSSLKYVGKDGFHNCSNLNKYYISDISAWMDIEFKDDNWDIFDTPYSLYLDNQLIKDLVIPDGVTDIGEKDFLNCVGIESVTIPDSVNVIGDYAFNKCKSLKSVSIANGVTDIEQYAFDSCTSLTTIEISDSVINIGKSAFNSCTSLADIKIPDSVRSIGEYAFGNTAYYKNTDNWENEVLYIDNALIKANKTLTGEYNIKSGTKVIADYAFSECRNMTGVTIPDGVVAIGSAAFEYCTVLTEVIIPQGVTNIGSDAFDDCIKLESIAIPKTVTNIGRYAFYGCKSLRDVYIEDVAVWASIPFGSYYSNPLYYADYLYVNKELTTELVIPEGVTSISKYAFYNQAGLTSVTLPDSLESIEDYAFMSCKGLKEIAIPEKVEYIGVYAFHKCESLTSITILSSETEIKDSAFSNTGYYDDINNWENDVLYIQEYLIDAKISLTGQCSVKEGTKTIAEYAFRDCKELTKVKIPDSVNKIGDCAFLGCVGLKNVSFPEKNVNIGKNAIGYYLVYYYNAYHFNYAKENGLKIYGYPDTQAQVYANDNEIEFVDLLLNPTESEPTETESTTASDTTESVDCESSIITTETTEPNTPTPTVTESESTTGADTDESVDCESSMVTIETTDPTESITDSNTTESVENESTSAVTDPTESEETTPSQPKENTYTITGSSGLCGSEWVVTDTDNDMIPNSDGTYKKVYCGVAAGVYEFKIITNHSWENTSYGDNGGNFRIMVKSISTVTINFNSSTGKMSYSIKKEEVVTDPTESTEATDSTQSDMYYPEYTGSDVSIVTALNSLGIDSSKAHRAEIAKANGIDYSYLPEQNMYMLNLLKEGKLLRPSCCKTEDNTDPAPTTDPSETEATNPIEPTEKTKTVIKLSKTSGRLYIKSEMKIKATVKNGVGSTKYKSTNTKIATINSKGKVVAKKAGKVKIKVTNNGITKTFTLTVKKPKLNKTNFTLKKGKKFTLKITGKIGKAKFKSNNKKIATVNAKGRIVAKKKGSTVITVKTNGVTLKCKVKVK